MDVRKQVITDCAELDIDWVIESRMWWEFFYIYTLNPFTQKDKWMKTWYSNEDAVPEDCTAKSISYNTWAIGATIAKFVKELLLWNPVIYGMESKHIVNIEPIF